jgi:hypothetical protein
MKTFLKVLLVLLVLGALAVGGYFAIVGTAGERGFRDLGKLGTEVVEGEREGLITARQFRSVKRGTSQKAVVRRLGKPASPRVLENQPDVQQEPANAVCLYYGELVRPGEGARTFRFCFRGAELLSKRAD